MKIILLKNIINLGVKGDIISVKPGYAKNYLFPKLKATLYKSKIELSTISDYNNKNNINNINIANKKINLLNKIKIIKIKINKNLSFIKSIKKKDIINIIKQKNKYLNIKEKEILLPNNKINKIGKYIIKFIFYKNIKSFISIIISNK